MIMELYYPDLKFTYKVDVWRDEYIEYLWEKETGVKFHPLSYFLESSGKEIYSKIEKEWINNKLPLYDIRQEKEFYSFLLDRFEDKAKSAYWKREEERHAEEDYLKINLPQAIKEFKSKDASYTMLTDEELEEIFLDNFMGEI